MNSQVAGLLLIGLMALGTLGDDTLKLILNGQRMALLYGNDSTSMADCRLFGDKSDLEAIRTNFPGIEELDVEEETFELVATLCDRLQQERDKAGIEPSILEKRGASLVGWEDLSFIRPGTKWCGKGNIATSYDDLGTLADLDKCCRTHDHCEITVPSLSSKFGLFNKAPYTKSDCGCDETLHQCFLALKSEEGDQMCNIFFNKLNIDCIRLNFPKKCTKSWIGYCLKEERDTSQPKVYEFYDQPSC